METSLTAIFEKSPYGYIGYVEELPGANTQGNTLEEVKKNLIEAVKLVLETNRQLSEEEIIGRDTIKESFGTISICKGESFCAISRIMAVYSYGRAEVILSTSIN
jgi:predicted RNase H-like HicB family nuclease